MTENTGAGSGLEGRGKEGGREEEDLGLGLVVFGVLMGETSENALIVANKSWEFRSEFKAPTTDVSVFFFPDSHDYPDKRRLKSGVGSMGFANLGFFNTLFFGGVGFMSFICFVCVCV